jgi:hypothetical protein
VHPVRSFVARNGESQDLPPQWVASGDGSAAIDSTASD